jgi:hypothetical protein
MRTSKLIIICILICIERQCFLQLWNIPLELIKSLNGPYIQCHSYWYGAY